HRLVRDQQGEPPGPASLRSPPRHETGAPRRLRRAVPGAHPVRLARSALMDSLPNVGEFLVWFVVFLFTLTFHEACHGLVALIGGDRTAYPGGPGAPNPPPHLER